MDQLRKAFASLTLARATENGPSNTSESIEKTTQRSTTSTSPLLSLPKELFDTVIKNLSPQSAWYLLQCSKALFNYDGLWSQKMHTPLTIRLFLKIKPGEEDREYEDKLPSKSAWDSLQTCIRRCPQWTQYVRHLALPFDCGTEEAYSNIAAAQMYPNIQLIGLRSSILSSYVWLAFVTRLNFDDPSSIPKRIQWTSDGTRFSDKYGDILEFSKRMEGIVYIVGRSDYTAPVTYHEFRIPAIQEGIELYYEGEKSTEEFRIEDYAGKSRILFWKLSPALYRRALAAGLPIVCGGVGTLTGRRRTARISAFQPIILAGR